MTSDGLATLLRETLGENASTDTKQALAEALEQVPLDPPPSGTYLCGCAWNGAIIPHFCPRHHQPPIFEIREARS